MRTNAVIGYGVAGECIDQSDAIFFLKNCSGFKTDSHFHFQVTLLKSTVHDKYILIANTHLYFHPDADHIRLLQIGLFMLYVKHVREEIVNELKISNDKLSIVFCGDFNSVPECGIYKLMTEQFVPDNFVDFKSSKLIWIH